MRHTLSRESQYQIADSRNRESSLRSWYERTALRDRSGCFNYIAKDLLPIYEAKIKTPNIGQIVHEVFDLETYEPKPACQKVNDDVKQEAIDLGIPLDD